MGVNGDEFHLFININVKYFSSGYLHRTYYHFLQEHLGGSGFIIPYAPSN